MSFVHDSGLFISFSGGLCPYWLTRSEHTPIPVVHTAYTATECDPRRPKLTTSTARQRRRACAAFVKVSALRKSLSSSDVSTLMQF